MATVDVHGLNINYEEQGAGDPLLMLPYLGADQASFAFQFDAHAAQIRCISVDLPGVGLSDKPPGPYSMPEYAEQIAEFLTAIGVERTHVMGISLGSCVGMHLAAQRPEVVASLSLHSSWPKSDAYVVTAVQLWRSVAQHSPTVAEATIASIFPFCFTPEMYAERADFVSGLEDFVRSRPPQPLDAFLAQTEAVLAHDATGILGRISAPTLITFGAHDIVTSTRFAKDFTDGIDDTELVVFDHLSHAGLHEDPEAFNSTSLDFLGRHPLAG